MKIFVSHSMRDEKILNGIEQIFGDKGIKLLIAEHEVAVEGTITDKIKGMIDVCDFGLILLTKNGLKSGFVREEIGYLEAKNKRSLMLFEEGIKKEYAGFKYGHDSIILDSKSPEKTLEKVKQVYLQFWSKIQTGNKKKEELKRKEQQKAVLAISAVVLLLLFGSSE